MRIHVMGSAAADGWPAIWCRCGSCRRARELGGKNIRSRSGALIDGDLKIDLSPDTYMQSLRDGIELGNVRNLLVTHSHYDHFLAGELLMYVKPFAHDPAELHVWGDQWIIQSVKDDVGNWSRPENLHQLTAYEPVTFEETVVTPLRAAHYPQRGCFNYVIQRGGKTLLYGMDSGWFPEDSWEAQKNFTFDVVMLDCTHGLVAKSKIHGGADTVIKTKERMLQDGTATDATRFIATHFSHNGNVTHDEFIETFEPHGIEVGYDGMIIEA